MRRAALLTFIFIFVGQFSELIFHAVNLARLLKISPVRAQSQTFNFAQAKLNFLKFPLDVVLPSKIRFPNSK